MGRRGGAKIATFVSVPFCMQGNDCCAKMRGKMTRGKENCAQSCWRMAERRVGLEGNVWILSVRVDWIGWT